MTPAADPQLQGLSSAALEPSLKRALGVSLIFHAVLFFIFAVRAAFAPMEPLVIENTIRVDIVGLPDKVATLPPAPVPAPKPEEVKLPEPKKETLPEPPKPVEAKPEPAKVNLNKAKNDQAAALKRLNAIENLRRQKQAKSETKDSEPALKTPSTQVKGNAVNAGNSLTGLAKVDNENYRALLKDQVTRRWNLPQWLSNANLSATVKLFVDERGDLLKKELVRSSKNAVFDESVMKAIEAAAPLPRPPSGLVDQIAVYGISIEFSPSDE